jgi:hypothetical protein
MGLEPEPYRYAAPAVPATTLVFTIILKIYGMFDDKNIGTEASSIFDLTRYVFCMKPQNCDKPLAAFTITGAWYTPQTGRFFYPADSKTEALG